MDLKKKNGSVECVELEALEKHYIGSLAAVNDYCHLAGMCFPSVFGSPLPFSFNDRY